ncbi:MAG: transposase family protein [Chloroflexi bacterium]|nr:MAG: transposase family protein [Chloroflexota bacterium]
MPEFRSTPVLSTWDICSEKGTLRGIYWSHSACRREAEKVESESIHVFQTLVPFILFAKEKPVFHVLIPLRQRIALCFHALYGGIVRWMKPRSTSLLFGTIADLAKGKSELLVENALLRQQLIILHRQVKRPACKKTDRFLLLLLARMIRTWKQALFIVQPETLLRWHRELYRLFWKHRSKADSRQPKISPETIALIKEMSSNNRLWGAERIRGELLKLGIRVCKRTIQKYMRHVHLPRPRGQKWATFLHNHAADMWACDFLQVTDLFFRSLFAFFIIELQSRKVIHVGVTRSPTDAWTAQQLREATPYGQTPKYLIRDNDGKFGPCFARVAATSGIKLLKTPYHAPRANAICERFLGSVRRECLDHILILNEKQLHRVLRSYVAYFNRARPHQGIQQQIPELPVPSAPPHNQSDKVIAVPVLGGLHHDYRRVA